MGTTLEILLFLLAFALLAGLIVSLLGYVNGWFKLRRIYKSGPQPLVREWTFQTGEFYSSYNLGGILGKCNHVLKYGYTDRGVYLGWHFPFSSLLGPILVPWDDLILTSIEGKGLGFVQLPDLTILVPDSVYSAILGTDKIVNVEDLALTT